MDVELKICLVCREVFQECRRRKLGTVIGLRTSRLLPQENYNFSQFDPNSRNSTRRLDVASQ